MDWSWLRRGKPGRASDGERDAAVLLGLLAPRQRRLRAAAVVDGSFDEYREVLVELSRQIRLEVFVPEGAEPGLTGMRTTTYADADQLDELLVARPGRDLFADLRAVADAERLSLWRRAHFHVIRGGAYVHPVRAAGDLPAWSRQVAARTARGEPVETEPAEEQADGQAGGEGEQATGQDADDAAFDELASSTRAVTDLALHCGDVVVYRKSRLHLYRVRDRDAALVHRRQPAITVDLLGSVPAAKFESRATTRQHGSAVEIRNFKDSFRIPELHIWHYRGRFAVDSHMLTYFGTTLLPPSFRFPESRSLHNPRLIPSGDERWARLRRGVSRPTTDLPGDYFDLNPGYPRMFGHVMTQTVHKLWAWDEAKRQLPGLKALIHIPEGYEPTVERAILTAYGIAEEDICFFHEPVYVESLVSPTIIWEYSPPVFTSPLALETWRRIGRGLGVEAVDPRTRLFVSRRESVYSRRACRNTDDVEALFRRYGFTVVYPEDYSLAEQARMFAEAKVIGGFGGSAMFNMMWSQPEQVIVLNQEGYRVRNEHLYAALLGADIDFFWSTADIEQPEVGRSQAAFTSAWDFDFERNGEELTALLESLPE